MTRIYVLHEEQAAGEVVAGDIFARQTSRTRWRYYLSRAKRNPDPKPNYFIAVQAKIRTWKRRLDSIQLEDPSPSMLRHQSLLKADRRPPDRIASKEKAPRRTGIDVVTFPRRLPREVGTLNVQGNAKQSSGAGPYQILSAKENRVLEELFGGAILELCSCSWRKSSVKWKEALLLVAR